MILILKRQRKTRDGIMGIMGIDRGPFNCFTAENLEKSIHVDTYDMNFTWSKRFQRIMPHIIVPYRDALADGGDAGIRIHWANFPEQLEGCIAVGNVQDENAVFNSKVTFEKLFNIIKDHKDLKIKVEWDKENV